mmetsp:Transcript_24374/g.40217  ORF Transcript_24374/g.40217 Transcript_24374/m.40217 type:complete len:444 (+) Transcript_24374:18-1349(+)
MGKTTSLSFYWMTAAFVVLLASGCAASDEDKVVAIATKEMGKNTALLGRIFPMFSKFFLRDTSRSSLSLKEVFNAVMKCIDNREVAIFAAIGWGLVPLTQSVYELFNRVIDKEMKHVEKLTPEKVKETVHKVLLFKPFKQTFTYQVVEHISQASKIGILVMTVDALTLIGKMMGFQHFIMDHISGVFSKFAYSGWIAYRVKLLKRYFLEKSMGSLGRTTDLGKLNLVDNLLDGTIVVVWLMRMLDFLEVETGFAVKSLFSVGATGTLVFGLASKDIASQIMAGLSLHLSEKIFEEDQVKFSDGTSGKITKMGWFETMIQNSDDVVVAIPNSQLTGQRVYNLSRTPHSQVQQTLRIRYEDASKIPLLLETIKEEIRNDCDKLIPGRLRAHWSNFEDDHLQVVVDAHFSIKPTGVAYHDNRQKVLQAIYRAVKKTGVNFEKSVRA